MLLVALGLALTRRPAPDAICRPPITKINVQGDFDYISQQAVQQRITSVPAASFFAIDLAGMRRELEQMPWIAHAEVRRVWPDQVTIRLEETARGPLGTMGAVEQPGPGVHAA